ncbi:MAG: glucose 1-dehydrogenase [Deltaproteobacteria bacterium]|nr:MAG: glucose 1-dehydrogenase [Deltaproteobacteria bacterium]
MADNALISLQDKVVVVTGGSRGIGAAIARACAAAGARVVVASRKQEGVDAVAADIRAAGGDALAVAAHTGHADQVDALFARAVDAFGRVDGLVNNAATNPYFGPMLGISEPAWDKTFEVNVKGYFYAARAFVAHARKRGGGGAIVNVASVAGRGAAAAQGVYAMTKAAVISMTQTLAVELGSSGIRVNALAPGLIDTKFASALVHNPAIGGAIAKQTPLGRIGRPEDIAGGAVYLLSDAAAFVTGEVLVIDGGLTVGAIHVGA